MWSISCRGDVTRPNGIPSTISGMMLSQKWVAVNFVLDESMAITEKLTGDQNMEIMTLAVDMIVLGQYCDISPSGSRISSNSVT
jgi:hypothetical protein